MHAATSQNKMEKRNEGTKNVNINEKNKGEMQPL
jgi:hypothetical protein